LPENKVGKSGKFLAFKNTPSSHRKSPRIHHKITTNYHAFSPQIPATPLKTPAKSAVFPAPPRQKKYGYLAKYLI
jgi:hypothetical protein